MIFRGFRCVIGLVIAGLTASAMAQDAIADLMALKKLSNVPLAYQNKVKPGAILTLSSNGSVSFFDADEVATPYSVAAMKGPLDTVTIEYIDSKLDKNGGFSVSFLNWQPGLKTSRSDHVTSDQAVLSVAALDQDQIDNLVYRDPVTLQRYQSWNKPGKKRAADIYLVEAVYWATELQITDATSKGVNGSSGAKLPTCDSNSGSSTKNDSNGDKKDDKQPDGTTTKKQQKDPQGGTVSTVATNAAKDALAAAAKDLGKIASASVSTATGGKTIVTVSGNSCVDKNDVAHLKSDKPVPVGMKVDLIGYFKSSPDTFDWSPIPPPRF